MKILFVAPLTRKITPKMTSSRPLVIFQLIEGLKKRGHKISVLGTKNSKIKGVKIIPAIDRGFYEIQGNFENQFYAHCSFLIRQSKILEKIAKNFDIVHNNCYPEFFPLLFYKEKFPPIVTTIHLPITPQLDEALSYFNSKNVFFIAISNYQKKSAKKTKIFRVIHHGVDIKLFKFWPKKENHLFWLGRLGKAKDKKGNFIDAKGIKWAIKLARETNSNLILSGNVEDKEFFQKEVKPYLNKKIKWYGKVSFEQPLSQKKVSELMRRAKAFLMPINCPEAFGKVIIEAQSSGTPVIGFDRGSVKELVKDGKTGFVVNPRDGLKGLKASLKKIDKIKPLDCRKWVERNFSLDKMIDNYEKLYYEVLKGQK